MKGRGDEEEERRGTSGPFGTCQDLEKLVTQAGMCRNNFPSSTSMTTFQHTKQAADIECQMLMMGELRMVH